MLDALFFLALSAPADACGGFACNLSLPVVQESEQIVFGLDPVRGEVEMHVQVAYSGPSVEFAWIVPVPAAPELSIGSSALFTRIQEDTEPSFMLTERGREECDGPLVRVGHVGCAKLDVINQPPEPALGGGTTLTGGIEVVGQQAVGPYETVTLQAQSTESLMQWLADNGYSLPVDIEEILAPYVADNAWFVALKLRKEADAGELAPLVLHYAGTTAAIPVRLTSISAAADMPMQVYVLGDTRAVPESYLHIEINEAAIDWWTLGILPDDGIREDLSVYGINYSEVVARAADEAGGHAFATDYYGDSDIIAPIWVESDYDHDTTSAATNSDQWIASLKLAIRTPSPELYAALEDLLSLDPGEGAYFWGCPECSYAVEDFEALTAALEARIIDPMRAAQALLERYPKLTRMSSSLDAIEMTVDPTFVLNPDMGEMAVSNIREADILYDCGHGRSDDKVDRLLVLSDGREIEIPSLSWLTKNQMSNAMYLATLSEPPFTRIEQTSASGPPVVLVDLQEELVAQALLGRHSCGCQSTYTGQIACVSAVLLLVITRRRRRAPRAW